MMKVADPYEREAMQGVGRIIYRYKVTSPRWLVGLAALLPSTILAALGLGLILAGAPLGGGISLAVSALLFVLMATLTVVFASARVAVSEGEIDVKLGMAGPKIPISNVASVEVAPSGRYKVGMGASTDLDGNRYIRMWGDNAEAVHIVLTNGKRVVFTSKEPQALAGAIRTALDRRDGRPPRRRIDDAASSSLPNLELDGDETEASVEPLDSNARS